MADAEQIEFDVFISYSSKNRAVAKKLAKLLREHGIDPWWDYELLGGQDFRVQIEAQIRAATAVVVIWSAMAVGLVKREGFAVDASVL